MMWIRPVEAGDVEELRALFFRLSPETVYLRFFSPMHEPTDAQLRHLAGVDHWTRDALAAVVDNQIVGVARYDRSASEPGRAELAVLVEDDWQGKGVGTVLITELAARARARGITTFTASVLGGNQRMLSLARRLGPTKATLDHGEWELEVPLAA